MVDQQRIVDVRFLLSFRIIYKEGLHDSGRWAVVTVSLREGH